MVSLFRSALANLIPQSAADVRHMQINPESDRLLAIGEIAPKRLGELLKTCLTQRPSGRCWASPMDTIA